MIITGKALEHYKIWFDKYYNDYWTYYQSKPTILNALIINWFDSVGIYINAELDYLHLVWFPTINNNWNFEEHEVKTRQEAIKEAIKKANEIYNEKYSISQ